jgi:hypothetical protein
MQTACRHSADLTQAILFFALVVLGLVTWLVPGIAPLIADVSGWQAAALVLAAIVSIRLLLAPYWIYKDQALEIRALRILAGARSPNLKRWTKLDSLTLGQAACLWVGQEPKPNMTGNPDIQFALEALKRAVDEERLEPDWTESQKTFAKVGRAIFKRR